MKPLELLKVLPVYLFIALPCAAGAPETEPGVAAQMGSPTITGLECSALVNNGIAYEDCPAGVQAIVEKELAASGLKLGNLDPGQQRQSYIDAAAQLKSLFRVAEKIDPLLPNGGKTAEQQKQDAAQLHALSDKIDENTLGSIHYTLKNVDDLFGRLRAAKKKALVAIYRKDPDSLTQDDKNWLNLNPEGFYNQLVSQDQNRAQVKAETVSGCNDLTFDAGTHSDCVNNR